MAEPILYFMYLVSYGRYFSLLKGNNKDCFFFFWPSVHTDLLRPLCAGDRGGEEGGGGVM